MVGSLFYYYEVPNLVLLGEEGLHGAPTPRATPDLLRRVLLVLPRHAHFPGMIRPGEAAAREGLYIVSIA